MEETKYNRKSCIFQYIQLLAWVILFLLVFLRYIPMFTSLFAKSGMPLPYLTRIAIAISTILRQYLILISIFVLFPLFIVASIFTFNEDFANKHKATIKTFVLIKLTLLIITIVFFLSMFIPFTSGRCMLSY